MTSTRSVLEITSPDDMHHHLRDGDDILRDVLYHADRNFARLVAMPNLQPPVLTVADARSYHERIHANLPSGSKLRSFLTLYLTDQTSVAQVCEAHASGLVLACKLYPQGATTNSSQGVVLSSSSSDASDSLVHPLPALQSVLDVMSDLSMPLLVHGEVADPTVDIFDRERLFIEEVLYPLRRMHPDLKIVLEHITTEEAVTFVLSSPTTVPLRTAATITPQHLMYNRSHLFEAGRIHPHRFCLPVLKRERHRLALLRAATSGDPRFFLGTDSAPHAQQNKESACGCAGIFSGHAAMSLYAEIFEQADALPRLEAFASHFGADFYGIPRNTSTMLLERVMWTVPERYEFGDSSVIPLKAGEQLQWRVVRRQGGTDEHREGETTEEL